MWQWFERADNARKPTSESVVTPSKKARTDEDLDVNDESMSQDPQSHPTEPSSSQVSQHATLDTANTHVQVSEQSSAPPGNNTDQAETDDML